MELKIESYQMPEKILFNFEELKKEITAKTAHFETLVYTEEQIKDAKADKAALNKLKKALNDERIKREREYMQSFNEFKGQINEIIGIIDRSVIAVDKQVKAYEEHTKQLKKEAIIGIYEGVGFPEWVDFYKIFDEKWLNATVKEKAIEEALRSKFEQIAADLATLASLPEFGFEASEEYKRTLDINRAIAEGRRLAEIQKRKAEQEAARKAAEEAALRAAEAEAKANDIGIATFENAPDIEAQIPIEEEEINKQWLAFRALLSVEDAQALKELFLTRNIKFEAIKDEEEED